MSVSRFILSLITSIFLLTACSKQHDKKEIYVGTMAGPESELMEVAKQVAQEKYGLKVIIVQFNDYALPNQALADGSIDANMFQHQPYLDAAIKAKKFNLTAIGKMFIYPMGVYSSKWKNISQIPEKAIVAIPNDPSNETRALLLLQQAGLIQLRLQSSELPLLSDITLNPKNLQFKELDAAQLPRILPDVDIAVINTNYALPAGLSPSKNAIFKESANSPYANLVVVRTDEKDLPKFKEFLEALHSNEVMEKANTLFKNQAIPAWK